MKQTIPTVYPPPPTSQTVQKQHLQKNTTKIIEWVSPRLSSRSPTPPTFLFCYATSKTFEWHFAGGPMVARHCVLAGIGYVHVLYRLLVALY